MATILDDQCIALIVQDTLKRPLPPSRAELGWGEVSPHRGSRTPINSASFLEGAWLSIPSLPKQVSQPQSFCRARLPCCPVLGPLSPWDRILGVEPQALQSSTTPTARSHTHISHVGPDPTAPSHPHHPFCCLCSARDTCVNSSTVK